MVQTPRFCTGCGNLLPPHVAFCTRCGKPVRSPGPAAPSPVHPGGMMSGMPVQPGHLLRDKYLVEKRLGSGGMGKVFLARHRDLHAKTFAIKEMDFEGAPGGNQADAVQRFFAEAETLAELNHPNIPQVFERFEERGRYFMVMEYVEGIDLEKLLESHLQAKGAPLPEAAVARLAFQLCDALDYLHRRVPPVIHRDLKPANAIVAPSGRVKLVDFGIARATGRRHTQAGTVGYAPREQYEGLTEPRSDLFSLGATLHHLVTGRLPVPFDFPPCRTLNPRISEDFETLLSHMLAMTPEGRPESARAVWKRLQGIHPEEALVAPGDPDALLETVEYLQPSGLLPAIQISRPPASPPPNPTPQSPSLQPGSPWLQPAPVSNPSGALSCPHCLKPNRATGRFCTGCGAPLTPVSYPR